MSRSRRGRLSALVAALALSVACGGDDDGSSSPVAAREEDAVDDAGRATATPAGTEPDTGTSTDATACDPTAVEMTNLVTGVTTTATTAFAKSGADGGLYLAYLADHDLDPEELWSFYPDVPDDGRLAIVQLTVFNASGEIAPLEAGTEVEVVFMTDGTLTFGVQLIEGDERHNRSDGDSTEGTLRVSAVGDTFCAEVDFVDQDKRITGTITAPVIGEF